MRALFLAALAPLLLASPEARADALPPDHAPRAAADAKVSRIPITLFAEPLFGLDVPPAPGWSELLVRVDNDGTLPLRGSIETHGDGSYGEAILGASRATIEVPVGRSALVRLPVNLRRYPSGTVTVRLLDAAGAEIAKRSLSVQQHLLPTLVEVTPTPRLGLLLRGWPVPLSFYSTSGRSYPTSGTDALRVGTTHVDPATGDPVLPDRTSTYEGVTAMVIRGADLARTKGAELTALAGWVLSGGTLAVIPSRPEDLRTPPLSTMLGGEARLAPAPQQLFSLPGARRPNTSPFANPYVDPDHSPLNFHAPGDAEPPEPLLLPFRPGASPAKITPARLPVVGVLGLEPAVREKLVGYTGGNLASSRFGASAAYGLGEVHLLAFDPLSQPGVYEPWSHARMIELVSRAWNRRALRSFPAPQGDEYGSGHDSIRRALDPNENYRPGLGVAALLFVLYAVLSGPVLHLRAARRGKPLEPLVGAPLLAIGFFGLIVIVGLATKGFRGRARHLTLVDAGAGMTRGSGVLFRGFFASEVRSLEVRGDVSVLLSRLERPDTRGDVLRLDRDGVTLEGLTSLPWQTVVVREHGAVYDLPGPVVVRPGSDGALQLTNRTGHALLDVIMNRGGAGSYFKRVEAGVTVRSHEGLPLGSSWREAITQGALSVHPLRAHRLRSAIGGPDGIRVEETWQIAESVAQTSDFWTDASPVVIGELEAPARAARDSGLSLEKERVLLRVVGEGGAP